MKPRQIEGGSWAVDIDGHTYAFEKWGAEDALDTLLEISAIAGGPVGNAVAMAFAKGGKAEITGDMASTVFDNFARNMRANKQAVKEVLRKMAGLNVLCDGVRVDYDKHYNDKLGRLFKVARGCFEVQYGRFFADALASVGIKRGQLQGSTTQDPTT